MTELYTKDELNAKAEVALMGWVTPVRDKDNIIYMLDYISNVVNGNKSGQNIYNVATEFINLDKTYIIGISCSTVHGMPCINIVFKDVENTLFKLDDPDGVLTYVYNLSDTECSELGYCFYERKGYAYHRIA